MPSTNTSGVYSDAKKGEGGRTRSVRETVGDRLRLGDSATKFCASVCRFGNADRWVEDWSMTAAWSENMGAIYRQVQARNPG
ncbi:MAG: hypothetical protein LC667_04930, partial [Thioalkalivibrio sp.]|nr:hypothetical protein [Thioalkalivibrio sp.]